MDYENIDPREYYNRIVFGAQKSIDILMTPIWQRHIEKRNVAPLFQIVPEADRRLRLRYIYLLPKSRSKIERETLKLAENDQRLPRVLGFRVMEVIGRSNRDCIIVDGKEAIVSDYLPDGGGRYLHVTDLHTIAAIEAYFEDVWRIQNTDGLRKEILYQNVLDIITSKDISSKIIIPQSKWDTVIAHLAQNPKLLHALTPRQFEELVAELFAREGYEVELTSVTRDGGKDLLLTPSTSLLGDQLYLVECKKYSPENPVGIGIIREMYGTVNQTNATAGMVVTTSTFTRDAIAFREPIKWRLNFKDYDNLSEWLYKLDRRMF